MRKTSTSLIPMPKTVVLERCRRSIKHIIQERERQDWEYVEQERARRNRGNWWNRLGFGQSRHFTHDEIKESLKKEGQWVESPHFLNFPSCYASGSLQIATQLLGILMHSTSETVYISPEDWNFIR